MRITPWEEVAVDLIGPCDIKIRGKNVQFNALMYINTASNLVEFIWINNETSTYIQSKFVQSWLSCYPRPIQCVHDKDSRFIG